MPITYKKPPQEFANFMGMKGKECPANAIEQLKKANNDIKKK